MHFYHSRKCWAPRDSLKFRFGFGGRVTRHCSSHKCQIYCVTFFLKHTWLTNCWYRRRVYLFAVKTELLLLPIEGFFFEVVKWLHESHSHHRKERLARLKLSCFHKVKEMQEIKENFFLARKTNFKIGIAQILSVWMPFSSWIGAPALGRGY